MVHDVSLESGLLDGATAAMRYGILLHGISQVSAVIAKRARDSHPDDKAILLMGNARGIFVAAAVDDFILSAGAEYDLTVTRRPVMTDSQGQALHLCRLVNLED